MELKASTDPVYFWDNPLMGNYPLFQFKKNLLNEFYKYEDNKRKYNELIWISGMGGGKALDINTPIMTTNGFKLMKDISIGDYVFSEKGEPVKVTYISPINYNRKCYEVTFDDGSKIKTDAQHDWLVEDMRYRKSISRAKKPRMSKLKMTTEKLKDCLYLKNKNGYYHNYSILTSEPLKFSNKELPIDPYLFGLWLGDGNSHCFGITNMDKEIIELVHTEAKNRGDFVRVNKKPNTSVCTYYITGGIHQNVKNCLTSKLTKLGVKNNKHIPECYKLSSITQRLELLRGIMDSDGCVSGHGYQITQKSKKLIDDIYYLLLSLGIKCSIKKHVSKLYGKFCGFVYTIKFSTDFKVTKLDRKQNNRDHTLEIKRRYIESVKEIESIPVKCISVDNPTHLYIAGKDLIPTHNSSMAALISLTEVYKLLMMKDPQQHYNLAPNSEISTINVANSRDQAKDTVFKAVKAIIANSPYFMSQEPDFTAYEIKFPKNITTKALGSNLGSAVGRSVKCFVADEIADYDNPEDTYQKLSKSTFRFQKWGEGIRVMIGSPQYDGDYLVTSLNKAREEKWFGTLTYWTPAWEANPNIDKEKLDEERKKDPLRFDRDMGAQPASARESLFNPILMKKVESRSKQIRNLFIGEPDWKSKDGFIPLIDYDLLRVPSDAVEYIIGTDPSVKNDAFGLSIGYYTGDYNVKIVGSTIFKSNRGEEIDSEPIKTIIKDLCESLPVKYYVFDAYLHSDLQVLSSKYGLRNLQHNLNLNDWIFTRNDLYDGTATIPYSEYLFRELKQLFIERNKRVEHPRSGGKDQADSIAQIISMVRRKQEEERDNSQGVVTNYVATF